MPLRILVVEDNRDAALMLAEFLELSGHTVRSVDNGRAALVAARDFQPDAVVCDLGLPGELDGYAVARAMRAEPALARARLVALSGYANDDARRRSRLAGFDAHIAKPPDLEELREVIAAPHRPPPPMAM